MYEYVLLLLATFFLLYHKMKISFFVKKERNSRQIKTRENCEQKKDNGIYGIEEATEHFADYLQKIKRNVRNGESSQPKGMELCVCGEAITVKQIV